MHQLELVIPHSEAASVRPMAVLVNCAIERLANEHHMEAAELVAGSPLEGGRWRRVCLGFAMRSSRSRIATEVLTWPVSKNGIRRCEGREDGWSTWWHSGSGCAPCASCRSAELDWSARHALHTPNKAKRPRSTPVRRARPSPPPPGTHPRGGCCIRARILAL